MYLIREHCLRKYSTYMVNTYLVLICLFGFFLTINALVEKVTLYQLSMQLGFVDYLNINKWE